MRSLSKASVNGKEEPPAYARTVTEFRLQFPPRRQTLPQRLVPLLQHHHGYPRPQQCLDLGNSPGGVIAFRDNRVAVVGFCNVVTSLLSFQRKPSTRMYSRRGSGEQEGWAERNDTATQRHKKRHVRDSPLSTVPRNTGGYPIY